MYSLPLCFFSAEKSKGFSSSNLEPSWFFWRVILPLLFLKLQQTKELSLCQVGRVLMDHELYFSFCFVGSFSIHFSLDTWNRVPISSLRREHFQLSCTKPQAAEVGNAERVRWGSGGDLNSLRCWWLKGSRINWKESLGEKESELYFLFCGILRPTPNPLHQEKKSPSFPWVRPLRHSSSRSASRKDGISMCYLQIYFLTTWSFLEVIGDGQARMGFLSFFLFCSEKQLILLFFFLWWGRLRLLLSLKQSTSCAKFASPNSVWTFQLAKAAIDWLPPTKSWSSWQARSL